VFGVHLWYGSLSNSPLDAAVRSYAAAALSSPETTAAPRPPYLPSTLTSVEELKYKDAIYELLMLYQLNQSKRTHMKEIDPDSDDPAQRGFLVGALQPLSSHPYLLDSRYDFIIKCLSLHHQSSQKHGP